MKFVKFRVSVGRVRADGWYWRCKSEAEVRLGGVGGSPFVMVLGLGARAKWSPSDLTMVGMEP